MEVAEPPRLRLILHDFLSIDLCKELEFIHKSCCTVGYRPNVLSTTLSHLIATNCAHLIMPFVSIRERLKEKVEEFFGCEYELFVEFTGLISWTKGASIGWHSDDNRSYLKQRDFAAVCYLNNHGKDFKGGRFHFQDGEPTVIVPVAGDAIIYTADNRNIHSVDEITDGERITLTLWFTRDSCHDEDAKLIALLSEGLLFSSVEKELLSCLPLLAPCSMYWFSPDQASRNNLGFDIRWARLHVLGYTIHAIDSEIFESTSDSMCDHSELVKEPLWLARGDEILKKEFVNSLHALQVVQFYCWKATDLQDNTASITSGNVVDISQSFMERSRDLKPIPPLCDESFVKTVFHFNKETGLSYTWAGFAASFFAWEEYTSRLHRQLQTSLPYWRNNQSIFYVS